MIRKFILISVLSLLSSLTWGQRTNVREEILAVPSKAYGTDYPYPTETPALTPVPKGYKPFYISHYGRHGSRYFWAPNLYKDIDSLLTEAHRKGALNADGEALFSSYEKLYPQLRNGWGELTPLGYEQHVRIARTMYAEFPQVFKKGGRVEAVSSLEKRCIVSMAAFCQALAGCDGELDIFQKASRETLPAVVPDSRENPYLRKFPTEDFPIDRELLKKRTASDGVRQNVLVDKYFNDISLIGWDSQKVNSMLNTFYTSLPNIDCEGLMSSPYTPEELYDNWVSSNTWAYVTFWTRRYMVIPILEDILENAEAVIEGRSDKVADLRFGHDSYLGPLTVLLGLDGASEVPENPAGIENVYQNFRTGMAGNIQLIFYRNKRNPEDILVKALLCGEEVTLPLPRDRHPYYRWSDFAEYYRSVCLPLKQNTEK